MNPKDALMEVSSWLLTPEGAAVHLDERTAVIADLHLGYEWARGKAGDSIPPHSLRETMARLEGVLERFPGRVARIIVAGDLVESRRPCRRTDQDVAKFRDWLGSKGISLLVLGGNHDPPHLVSGELNQLDSQTFDVAGWTIGHGHVPIVGCRVIFGHFHPVFRFGGSSAPCFLASDRRIILPAFSGNAAGLDILTGKLPPEFSPTANVRCLVSTGDDILDFGSLLSLRARL